MAEVIDISDSDEEAAAAEEEEEAAEAAPEATEGLTPQAGRPRPGDKWAGGAAGDGAVCSGWATAFWKKGEPIRRKQLTSAFQEHRNRLCLLRLIVCSEAFTYGLIARSIRPVFHDESECKFWGRRRIRSFSNRRCRG